MKADICRFKFYVSSEIGTVRLLLPTPQVRNMNCSSEVLENTSEESSNDI